MGSLGAGPVVPIVMQFVEDTETPVSRVLKLRGDGPSYLLESAEQGGRLGRHSFLGFSPRLVMRWVDGELLEWEGDAAAAPASGPGAAEPTSRTAAPDPYGAVAERLAGFELAGGEDLPFAGGAVGLFGYDLVRTVETKLGPSPNPDPVGLPDMALMISDVLVAFDHQRHEVTIIALAVVPEGGDDGFDAAYARAAALIERTRERLRGEIPRPEREREGESGHAASPEVEWRSNLTREQFESNVARIVEYLYAGDAFQVVPSQRFSSPCPVEAFSIYRGLRAVNPSPYMYFLDFGDFEIAGASPEPLLTVQGRRVSTPPLAGPRTAPRRRARRSEGAGRARDARGPRRSRNGLGRVCRPGTVKVDELMTVETYSHVLHIVSRVSGELREGMGALDVLRSALPGGTLSGAPKVRAMQIIDELRAGQALLLRRRHRLRRPSRRPRHGDPHPHRRRQGRRDAFRQAGGPSPTPCPPTSTASRCRRAKAIFRAVDVAVEHPEWS